MSGHTHTHTHIHTYTHTYTHDNYYNPRCAHAHRGLIIVRVVNLLVSSMATILTFFSGCESLRKCSKCFYVYLNICQL